MGSARPGVFAAEGLDFLGGGGIDFIDDSKEERGVAARNPGLLAMLEACAKGFAGTVGKVRGGVCDRDGRRGFLQTCGDEDLLEPLEEGVAAGFEFDVGKVGSVEDAFGEAGFCGKGAEHSVLDGVFGDEVDDGNRAELAFAPSAGDALLEFGGIPREIAIDDDAGALEVQPDAAGIGAKEEAAGGVVSESEDLGAAPLLGNRPGVPRKLDAEFFREVADELQHAGPLGEDDDFNIRVREELVEDAGEFVTLRTIAGGVLFDEAGGVADHSHAV